MPRSRAAVLPFVLALAAPAAVAPAQWIEPHRPPVWSADGARLLYVDFLETDTTAGDAELGGIGAGCIGIRCATPATGDVRPVLPLGRCWRGVAYAFDADGMAAIVAAGGEPDALDATTIVHVVPLDGSPKRRIEVARARGPRSLVVRGDALFLAAGDLVKIDLRRGATTARVPAPAATRLALLAAGPRLAYVARRVEPGSGAGAIDAPWEAGFVDESTLARERIAVFANAPGAARVAPWPCFAPDGEGFAVPASDAGHDAWEVQVHRGGVQLASFPVLPAEPAPDVHFGQALGNLAWSRDGESVWVASERFDGASHWQLWQLRVGGDPRATALGDGGRVRCIGACAVPTIALSPAGDRIAWSRPSGRTLVRPLPTR